MLDSPLAAPSLRCWFERRLIFGSVDGGSADERNGDADRRGGMSERAAKPPVVCKVTAAFFAEDPTLRCNAILFRGRVYVGSPRHMDAINLAFASMTDMQKHRIGNRIADGKEKMLFGTALGDGSEWEWDKDLQSARMRMYGFY